MAGQHKNKLNLDRLAKIWALAERGDAGEQAAARNRAEALVKPHGYTLAALTCPALRAVRNTTRP
ncbi:hypothetical protein AA0313_2346 [Acetobacter indonesiensis NRIC 0313]|nr:hypothetical protein [Acetobacter indonesiensis]GAN62594.1 hypothetical protein Abin_010_010 [Acetobacter indonesiensis]GBQ60291.1 hypothetical protein AA0313_2346 [Acetobacter indonesiensis NRIC 0313]